jgi:hypothetical protein
MLTRKSFTAALDNVKDVNQHYAFIDLRAAQGDLATLKELFIELCNREPGSRIPDWAVGAILERIVESLALIDGFENAATALELGAIADSRRAKSGSLQLRPSAVVSKLVAAQSPAVVDALLRTLSDLETAALVLQEAVVRRKMTAESSAGQDVYERLAKANHPLGSLPVTLFDLEEGILLPDYGLGSMGTSIPFGPTREQPTVATRPFESNSEITETTCAERANLISTAVMNWKDESNGKIEARTFRVRFSEGYSVAAILPRLGLESIKLTDVMHARENATAKEVFTVLFSAASGGGAYNHGNFAAYGRLLAWRSLAGLAGSSPAATVAAIAMNAQRCEWCLFDSPNEWYYQVAWDIGIACANPAQQELAVLSATDTD